MSFHPQQLHLNCKFSFGVIVMVVCGVTGALNNFFWKSLFSNDCYTLKRPNSLELQIEFQAISIICTIIKNKTCLNSFRNKNSLEAVHSISW